MMSSYGGRLCVIRLFLEPFTFGSSGLEVVYRDGAVTYQADEESIQNS